MDAIVSSQLPPEGATSLSPRWWGPGAAKEYPLGGFIGQGPRLQYCGFANAVVQRMECLNIRQGNVIDFGSEARELCNFLNRHQKPRMRHWLAGQLLVSIHVSMAFMVSFVTPTVGLGCRSSSYLLFWILTLPSSIEQVWRKKTPTWAIKVFVRPFQHLAAIWLILILLFQVRSSFFFNLPSPHAKIINFG